MSDPRWLPFGSHDVIAIIKCPSLDLGLGEPKVVTQRHTNKHCFLPPFSVFEYITTTISAKCRRSSLFLPIYFEHSSNKSNLF